MDETLAPKVLKYVTVSSALAKRALDELGVFQRDGEKAAALAPDLLTDMLQAEAIGDHQKEAVEKMLGSREGSTQLLKHAIDKIAELTQTNKKAGDLGEGVDAKAVGVESAPVYDSLTSPFVGAKTSEKKASDVALLRGLGIEQ